MDRQVTRVTNREKRPPTVEEALWTRFANELWACDRCRNALVQQRIVRTAEFWHTEIEREDVLMRAAQAGVVFQEYREGFSQRYTSRLLPWWAGALNP